MGKKCSGCGIVLQTKNKDKDGYVDDLNKDLCYRCFRQKHYNEYQETNTNNIESIFNNIKDNDLVVYVSSLLNLNIEYIVIYIKQHITLMNNRCCCFFFINFVIIVFIINVIINAINNKSITCEFLQWG